MTPMEEFELAQEVREEIGNFVADHGVAPINVFCDFSFDNERNKFSASIGISGSDAQDYAEALTADLPELLDQLRADHSSIKFAISVSTPECADEGDEELDEDDEDEEKTEDYTEGWSEDHNGFEDTDSVEKQYEDEGLSIIEASEEDELEDEDDAVYAGSVAARDVDQEDDEEDDELWEELDDDEQDRYIPTDEDIEELWRAFGNGEDY